MTLDSAKRLLIVARLPCDLAWLRRAECTTLWVDPAPTPPDSLGLLLEVLRPTGIAVDDVLLGHWGEALRGRQFDRVTTRGAEVTGGDIFFCVGSDTLARSLVPVSRRLPAGLRAHFFIPYRSVEGAGPALRNLQIVPRQDLLWALVRMAPRVVVFANDWDYETRLIILLARLLRSRTVCLQESVIDFKDPSARRMRWADHAVVQGVATCRQLRRRTYFLAGNPRYEELRATPVPPNAPVLINCNFTYGIHENIRDSWMTQAAQAVLAEGLQCVIAQHPRDRADLGGYGTVIRTHAGVIHDVIRRSCCVVSRFSSLLHEALALGRPAVYFNPHDEQMGYDFAPFTEGVLEYSRDKDGLRAALRRITRDRRYERDSTLIEMYCRMHFRPFPAGASAVAARFLGLIASGEIPCDGTWPWHWRSVRAACEMCRDGIRRDDR